MRRNQAKRIGEGVPTHKPSRKSASYKPTSKHGRVFLGPCKKRLVQCRYCTSIHWTSHFTQGTRNTGACITGHPVSYMQGCGSESGSKTFPTSRKNLSNEEKCFIFMFHYILLMKHRLRLNTSIFYGNLGEKKSGFIDFRQACQAGWLTRYVKYL